MIRRRSLTAGLLLAAAGAAAQVRGVAPVAVEGLPTLPALPLPALHSAPENGGEPIDLPEPLKLSPLEASLSEGPKAAASAKGVAAARASVLRGASEADVQAADGAMPAPARLGDALGRLFDRSSFKAPAAEAPFVLVESPGVLRAAQAPAAMPEGAPEGPPAEELLELRFLAAHAKSIFKSERAGTVRLIRNTKGSRRYWSQFKRGAPVAVVAGGNVLMKTKVKRAITKRIGQLTKDDLEGVFTEKELALLPIRRIRQAIVENLSSYQSAGGVEEPVSFNSRVRLVRFQSYREVHKGLEPPPPAPRERRPLSIGERSRLHQLNQTLPKVVLLDLDVFESAVPAELLEDMAKLQRTGVVLVGLSRRPREGANGAAETLLKNMGGYQRDVLLPYRFLGVFEGGAEIAAFERGGRVKTLSREAFASFELEGLRHALARAVNGRGPVVETSVAGGLFEAVLPKGLDRASFEAAFRRAVRFLGLRFAFDVSDADGRVVVRAAKTTPARSGHRILEALQDAHGQFVSGGDVLALTADRALLKTLQGTPDVAGLAGRPMDASLVEDALGAALGEHREDRPGDLAGSASRMGTYLQHHNDYLDRYVLEQEDALRSIHFFSGHMVHKALDWAVHQLKQGRRPTEDAVRETLKDYWESENRAIEKPLGLPPGHLATHMLSASQARAAEMYRHVRDIVDQGYRLLGTEIPNFFVLRSYDKKGEARRRYVIHTIFDLVALKPLGDGKAELVVLDFKSGPPQTMQKLAQDLQVLTYSLFLRYKWKEMAAPYRIVGGRRLKVEKARVEFLYSPVRLSPPIDVWALDKIEQKIIKTLDRMAKEAEQNIPKRRGSKGRR